LINKIIVSVVMPVYNEERYIERCIDSLLLQDYPKENMEWIFVDGCSTDNTMNLLEQYHEKYPSLIRIINNPKQIVPCAMNCGIKASKGTYIVRMDAHAEYALDYISKCIYYLEHTDADNVGGVAETKAKGFVGNAISKVLSSKFGVGNSHFRTNGDSGYVDTVPFGAFKREVFQKYGLFDERLARNEDNEINYRITNNGGKVYLANDIRLTYYCRDTIKGFVLMAKQNGMWNIIAMKLCPGSMRLRHFIPFIFVVSIIGLTFLGCFCHNIWLLLGFEMFLYFLLDIIVSVNQADCVKELLLLFVLFPIFHISYGCGSFVGLFKLFTKLY